MTSDDRAPDDDHISLPDLPKWVGKLTNRFKNSPQVDLASVMVGVLALGIVISIAAVTISMAVESSVQGTTGTSDHSPFGSRGDR